MNGSEGQQWEAEAAFSLLLVSAVAPADVQVNVLMCISKIYRMCKCVKGMWNTYHTHRIRTWNTISSSTT